MKVFKVKYGFWTTYEQTVFLKQEQNNSGRWVLKVSNVIKYDTASDLSVGRAGNLRGNVSLRECMLYLMHEAKLDYKANNNDVGFVEFVEPYSSTSTSQPQSQPKKDLSQGSIGIEDDNKQEGGGHHGRRRRVAAGTGKSLQPVEEASRDSSLRQQLATSGLQDLPRLVTRASSEGSSVPSTSSKHSAQRRPPEGEPRRSSTDVQRGRQSTRDSSQPRAGEAARARSTGKVMLSEKARGKQRETTASSSRERRARADASSGDRQEPPREPFRSSQGQTRRPHQWLEGDAKLYETPTDLHPPSQGGIFTSGPEATTQLPTRLAPALAPFKHIRHPLQREKQGPLLVSGRGIHLKKNKNPIRR